MSRRDHSRRFQFLRQIASGGFGSVYLAKVMHTDGFSRIAAVKLLHERWSDHREIAQRMRDEARLLGWLHHRNIVDVIDLTTIAGRVAVVMEYLEAVDLKTIGVAMERLADPMGPRAAMEVLTAVASALDAAYNRPPYQGEKPLRVIHRDIKPSNIMVDESGTVKVLDFGMARADFEQRESHTQELQFGSLDYMPPERLYQEPEGAASDVYSLGCTVFEVLGQGRLGKAKGKPARHTEMVRERVQALHAALDLPPTQANAVCGLLGRMLAYAADERPTAGDVSREARSLARLLDGEGLQEWAERVIPPLVREAREAPRDPDPLVGSVLTEDSPAGRGGDFTDPGLYERPPSAPRSPPPVVHEPALGASMARSPAAPVEDDGGMATVIYDTPPPQRQATNLADARPRAMPVVRPASRRGPPPPVTLEPPVPLADDPSVLSAPFPRQIDADGRPSPLPTVTPEDLVAGPIAPSPVVRSAVTRSPARPPEEEDDDDSDAHLLELHRSSPTLVFPLEVEERTDDDEPEATVPGRALVEYVGDVVHEEPPAPDDPIPAPAPFPRAGSALALPPPTDDAPRPPDPSVVSQARPTRSDLEELRLTPDPRSEPRPAVDVCPASPALHDLGPSSPESWEDRGTRPGTPVVIRKVIVNPAAVDPGPVARVRRAAPPPPEPVTPPAPVPIATPPAVARPAGSGPWLWIAGAALLVVGAVTIGGAWGCYRWFVTSDAVATSPPTVAAPAASAPAEAPPELAAGAIRFVSAATGTTRLTATCDGAEIVGTTWVDWTGPSPRACTVRAQLKDRTRLYAEVAAPAAGAWTCFDNGGKACAP